VNFADLVLLAQNYNKAVPADAVPAAFAGEWAAAMAAVPEPSALGLGLVVLSLLKRQRRQR
jgi:hypothetical protein